MTELEAFAALSTVLDPEVGLDVVDLGLISELEVFPDRVSVRMIMTSAACPMHGHLISQAEKALATAAGPAVTVDVQLATEPPWTPERMSVSAREKLGW